MTNEYIERRLHELTTSERMITAEILLLIREAGKRRLYLLRGYPSLFEWLVHTYKYSHSSAFRRIEAARLQTAVPELNEKIQSGEINLTTASQLQTALRRHEKNGHTVTAKQKQNLVQQIENKTSDETGMILAKSLPGSVVAVETLRAVAPDQSRLNVILDSETVALLKEVKEMMGHIHPGANWADVIKFAAQRALKKSGKNKLGTEKTNSKVEKETSTHSEAAAMTQFAAAPAARSAIRREILSRGCEFKDPRTGRVCGSRFQLEVDHIHPRALGGSDDISNLRCLCRQHNLLMAQRVLGRRVMAPYWGGGF